MAPRIVTVAEVSETQFSQLFDQFEGNLEQTIEAAEDYVIGILRYDPVATTVVEVLPITLSADKIRLKNYPINAVTLFEVAYYPDGPWTPVATTGFYINYDTGYITPRFLGTAQYARITYSSGSVEVPAAIRQAVIIKTALLAAPDYEIFGSGDSREPGLGHYDRMIHELLWPYIKRAIG